MSNCQPTLTSLPNELLIQIAVYLDLPAALSLALVSRCLREPAAVRIWSKLDLTAAPNYPVWESWMDDAQTTEYGRLWSDEELRVRRVVHGRLKAILRAGGAKRLGMVEAIRYSPKAGSVHTMVDLLEEVSESIRSLEVIDNLGNRYDSTIDVRLLDRSKLSADLSHNLSFPSLTHLHLSGHSFDYLEFIPFLIALAPNLLVLDFQMNSREQIISDPDNPSLGKPDFPKAVEQDTKLRELRIAYYDDEEDTKLYDPYPTIVSLLRHSPELRELSLAEHYVSDDFPALEIANIVGRYEHLTGLYWPLSSLSWTESSDSEQVMFPSLRRLAIEHLDFTIPVSLDETALTQQLEFPPKIPSLESLYLDSGTGDEDFDPGFSYFTETGSTQPIGTPLADYLLQHPHLRNVHFLHTPDNTIGRVSDVFAPGEACTGCVRSFRHGQSELLQLELLLQDVEVSEPSKRTTMMDIDEEVEVSWNDRILYVQGAEDWLDEHVAWKRSAPIPTMFTYFDGMAVPMEVVEKVKEVEDAGKEFDWDRRGVEVSERAWRVLMDWRESTAG